MHVSLKALVEKFGDGAVLKRKDIIDFCDEQNLTVPQPFLNKKENRVGRGEYRLPSMGTKNETDVVKVENTSAPIQAPISEGVDFNVKSLHDHVSVPVKDELYVPFGFYDNMVKILKSRMFYPIFVSGDHGNGKTMMCEQACAEANRECVRVQINPNSDEDDLIGNFRLVDGETKFFKGPILTAMEHGSVVIIDEIDRGNSGRIMCLQGILEGKPYFVKKTGERIDPVDGFQIIATANTKGSGSIGGSYVAASVLDEAFLERFPITVNQKYPPAAIEKKILSRVADKLNLNDFDKAIMTLTKWADTIRISAENDAIDAVVSTRRLVNIVEAYYLLGDFDEAMMLCLNRFDSEDAESMIKVFEKLRPEDMLKSKTKEEHSDNEENTSLLTDEEIFQVKMNDAKNSGDDVKTYNTPNLLKV